MCNLCNMCKRLKIFEKEIQNDAVKLFLLRLSYRKKGKSRIHIILPYMRMLFQYRASKSLLQTRKEYNRCKRTSPYKLYTEMTSESEGRQINLSQ